MEKLAEQHSHGEEHGSLEKKVVLVIDDNADLLNLNQTILEIDGFEVFTALGGKEALNILSRIKQPDLILLDMRMENMSGTEFLTALEEKMPNIVETVPIVFLTAVAKVPCSKAVGFIRKPFDIETFVQAIHRFIKMGVGRGVS